MKGYTQVYTGNGKGKTTAAFGLALRAAGAGLRVYVAQFAKGSRCSELNSVATFAGSVTLEQYGLGHFFRGEPNEMDIEAAREGLEAVKNIMCSGRYDVVILDEANIATYYKLFPVEDLLHMIRGKPGNVELIITGRQADSRVIDAADLVTEMKEIKHYYHRGVQARIGIEK